jgi:hypothetical protein
MVGIAKAAKAKGKIKRFMSGLLLEIGAKMPQRHPHRKGSPSIP